MTKKTIFIAFLGMFLFLNSPAYAHSMDGRSNYERSERQSQCPVADKFMRKTHFLLENQADLGLTAEQVKAIKDLKLQVEKDSIHQTADMDIFTLDLRSKLEEDKVDVEGTNALIDKGFASATTVAKANVEAYAKLKGIITPDQLAKMKELMKAKKDHWKNKDK